MLQAKAMTMHVFLPLFSCHVSKITPNLLNDTVGVPKKAPKHLTARSSVFLEPIKNIFKNFI